MTTPLTGVVYSDIHLGHRNTPIEKIIKDLKKDIKDDIKQFKPQILFIAGDLFDRHLSLTSEDSREASFFMSWLLSTCKKNNIIVRLLEGTPSHDWKQGWLLGAINASPYLNSNAKWVSELSIEFIDQLGISVLYIPDEWSSSTDDTKYQVIELLAKHELEQVDVVVMHGMFPHQIPPHVNAPVHDHEFYQKITKRNIFCGHVHKFSQLDKLIVPSSHNRLAHGEEEPKGHIRFTYTKTQENVVFVENKAAMIYKTIDCTDLDTDALMNTLSVSLKRIPDDSFIRVLCKAKDPANVKNKEIRDLYPNYNWKIDVDSTSVVNLAVQDDSSIYRTTPITDVTIDDLVVELMKERGLDEQTMGSCLSALSEVKKWIRPKER